MLMQSKLCSDSVSVDKRERSPHTGLAKKTDFLALTNHLNFVTASDFSALKNHLVFLTQSHVLTMGVAHATATAIPHTHNGCAPRASVAGAPAGSACDDCMRCVARVMRCARCAREEWWSRKC